LKLISVIIILSIFYVVKMHLQRDRFNVKSVPLFFHSHKWGQFGDTKVM